MTQSEAKEVKRLEEIRHTLEHEEEFYYYRYQEDVTYLLQRVEELEAENERLRRKLEDLGHKEPSGGWHRAVDHVVDNGDGTYSHHLTRPT